MCRHNYTGIPLGMQRLWHKDTKQGIMVKYGKPIPTTEPSVFLHFVDTPISNRTRHADVYTR